MNGQLELTEEETKWLSDEFWPTPSWLTDDDDKLNLDSYEDYSMYQLRVRYVELESDFRLTFSRNVDDPAFVKHARHFAHRIVELLKVSRQGLEAKNKRKSIHHLLNITNSLSLVDSYRIWLYKADKVEVKYQNMRTFFEQTHPERAKSIRPIATRDAKGMVRDGYLRDSYMEMVNAMQWAKIVNDITFGLQVERLQLLIRGGIFTILLVMLFSPLFMADLKDIMPPLVKSLKFPMYVNAWLMMAGFTVIGALGGFFSGLMQVKSNRVGLGEYNESKLKFQLKPVVGGLTATILCVFLSWQVLPGITIQSFGSYLLIAFLSGFSERYFLNLLKMDPQKGEEKAKKIKQEEPEKPKKTMADVEAPEKILRDEFGVSLKPTKPFESMPTMPSDPPAGVYQTSGSSGGSKGAYNPEDEENLDDKVPEK